MVAVILVPRGLVTDDLESLLKPAGWSARHLSATEKDGGLAANLKMILVPLEERNSLRHTAWVAAVDLHDADRAVEQILGQCHRVRIILVAPDSMDRDARRAVLRALRSGADDFVAASAVASELPVRLNANRSRSRRRQATRLQQICGLQLERGSRRLRHGEKTVSLTPCEYRVFACLAGRPGNAVSRATIQKDLARRSRSSSKNMVDVYVLYLRRKLATLGCSCSIRTIRGVGYSLSDEAVTGTPSYQPSLGSSLLTSYRKA
jgi:DNA-binding response OmpR family regulator